MEFTAWLTQWFARHPLKAPAEEHSTQYTLEVMQQVKALARPVPSPRPTMIWLTWPRLGLATACTSLLVLLASVSLHVSTMYLARAAMKDAEVLEEFSEGVEEPLAVGEAETLTKELELHDAMVLAEAQPSDEQWIEQNLQVLDQFDDPTTHETTPHAGTDAGTSEEDLLNDLQLFDNAELPTTS